ncbi:MAG TPA: hypothetical protein DIW44_05315 [Anaerolineaceae bacterium]|nr:hypothetical protein [Anaerolineaceae bacterium]
MLLNIKYLLVFLCDSCIKTNQNKPSTFGFLKLKYSFSLFLIFQRNENESSFTSIQPGFSIMRIA